MKFFQYHFSLNTCVYWKISVVFWYFYYCSLSIATVKKNIKNGSAVVFRSALMGYGSKNLVPISLCRHGLLHDSSSQTAVFRL